MSIRSSAKALIVNDGKILVNKCRHKDGSVYYDLPGGGQRQYEALEDAVIREVMEETGYAARVVRFDALAEEIHTGAHIRNDYPEYAHRMLHIFVVELTAAGRQESTELDFGMEKSEWLAIDDLKTQKEVYPPALCANLDAVLAGPGAMWLGTAYK